MTIEIQCSACNFLIQADDANSGKQVKCPQCGMPVGVSATAGESSRARIVELSQATADDIVHEISHRGKSAVLVLFETPASSDYSLQSLANAKVRVYSTNEMDDAKTLQALSSLGRIAQGKGQAPVQAPAERSSPRVFELKGDPLGMTLAEFKRKHGRKTGGIGLTLPWCSDSSPGQAIPALQAEPWHSKCGIVHARVDLPAENNSPTVAGVKTELLLYQFVDERLFRITAYFDTDSFHVVREAISEKHGNPTGESLDPMQFMWDNGVSSVHLLRGSIRPKKPSRLHYVHNQLQKQVDGRTPKVSDDL